MSGLEIVEQQTDSEDDDDEDSETDEEEPTEGGKSGEELTVDQVLEKIGTLQQDIEEEDEEEEEEEQRVYAVEPIQVADKKLLNLNF